jgi:putative SOS response-associated peptidase YedK
MPVMLPQDAWETWLDPAIQDIEVATKLLVPAPPDHIDIYAVSTEVNNVRNKGAHLLDVVEPTLPGELPGQATLL